MELTPEDPLAGLNRLLKALESLNGKTDLDRKGELRSSFYLDLRRKPGERLSEFGTRFRTLTAELKQEGIKLPAGELGWFLKSKLGLDPLRQQLLETALAGKEDYDVVESEVLRLFKDLHTSDPLMRKPMNEQRPPLLQRFLAQAGSTSTGSRSSYPSSMASSSGRSFRSGVSSSRPPFKKQFPPRQSHVTELEEEQVEEEGEPDEEGSPDRGPQAFSLEEVLQTEAEVLATEIEEAENEGIDTEFLNELESGVEQAAESLITMREARGKLAEVCKDRGYGKPSTSNSPPKTKVPGNQINSRKQSGKHPCWDCNEHGHWVAIPTGVLFFLPAIGVTVLGHPLVSMLQILSLAATGGQGWLRLLRNMFVIKGDEINVVALLGHARSEDMPDKMP